MELYKHTSTNIWMFLVNFYGVFIRQRNMCEKGCMSLYNCIAGCSLGERDGSRGMVVVGWGTLQPLSATSHPLIPSVNLIHLANTKIFLSGIYVIEKPNCYLD